MYSFQKRKKELNEIKDIKTYGFTEGGVDTLRHTHTHTERLKTLKKKDSPE